MSAVPHNIPIRDERFWFRKPFIISDNGRFVGAVYTTKNYDDLVLNRKSEPREVITWVKIAAGERDTSNNFTAERNKQISLYRQLLANNFPIKKTLLQVLSEYNKEIEHIMISRRGLERGSSDDIWAEVRLEWRVEYVQKIKKLIEMCSKKIQTKTSITEEDIEKARSYPVDSLVDFVHNFASCIFGHEDKTPSMKYYEGTNSVHCFSCHKSGDAITVYRTLHGTNFIEAVKFLSGK